MPTKVLLFATCVGAHDFIPTKLVLVLYCCMVYLSVDIIFGVFNGVMHVAFNVELEQTSDEPYCATSLQDFWGRRWNLMVTNLLRHSVYSPVRLGLKPVIGQWAALPAVLATFLVSGLMHELLVYHITRASPTWEITWFFVLHGLCLVVEFGLKKLFAGKVRLHGAVSGPLTVGFVLVTAIWLFFPPLLRTGVTSRALQECKMMMDLVKNTT